MPLQEREQIAATEKDIDVTLQCPAIYVNKFTVSAGPIVRMTFIEQNGPDAKQYPRAAISMIHQDAIAFYKILQRLLKDAEEQLEKLTKGSEEGPKNG